MNIDRLISQSVQGSQSGNKVDDLYLIVCV